MEVFSIEDTPEWALERTMPEEKEASEKYLGSPFYYLLVDFQERLSTNKFEACFRAVEKINDASRIEDSSLISRELRKENERLIFHYCKIYRDGEEIDALDEEEIKILQRETSLERHITDEKLTFSLSINDLRVGDILDYSYTIVESAGEHPLAGKFYIANFWLNWICPVIAQYVRVINLSEHNLTLHLRKIEDGVAKLEKSEIESSKTKELIFNDLNRSSIDQHAPSWVTADCLDISTKNTWENVSKYLYSFYLSEEISNDIDLNSVEGLVLSGDKKTDIIRITRFVQDQIRYKGEHNGIYSHTPKDPLKTLKKRSGDCKDKSNLLVALLKNIGVQARLLLVNTSAGRILNQKSPSAYRFDHMIVEVTFENKQYYFDPTIQKQRGDLEHTTEFFYGWGLPIDKTGLGLIGFPLEINKPVFDLSHTFKFGLENNGQNTLEINRKYYSHRSDNVRFYVASKEKAVLEDEFLQSAKSDTNLELEIGEAYQVVRDDEVLNEIETKEIYIIQNIETTHKGKRVELGTDFYHELPRNGSGNYPLIISLDGNLKHTVTSFYSQKIGALQVENKLISNNNFSYRDRTQQSQKSIEIESTITIKDDIVREEDVKDFIKDVESVAGRSTNSFIWKKTNLFSEMTNKNNPNRLKGMDWFYIIFSIIWLIYVIKRFFITS